MSHKKVVRLPGPQPSQNVRALSLALHVSRLLSSEHFLSTCCISGTLLDTFLPSFHSHSHLME